MAKKKPTSVPKDEPAKKPAAKKTAKPASPKPASTSTATTKAAKSPELTLEDIGNAAGSVWLALQNDEGLTLAALKKATGISPELTMAGLGWLAREDKLTFDASGRAAKIVLK